MIEYPKLSPQNVSLMSKYRLWIIKVLTRDGYKCLKCGKDLSKTINNRYVHYIKSRFKFSHLRDKVENGITLCENCYRAMLKVPDYEKACYTLLAKQVVRMKLGKDKV